MVPILIYLSMIDEPENRSKFEEVYTRYRSLMYLAAYRILQNSYDAEDAVHQAFVSVLSNLDKIVKIDCPETSSFLVLITERKAIDIYRARRTGKLLPIDEEILGIEIPLPGDNGLADALAGLPSHYREVLLLRFDNGYSTRDLAQILHLTPSGVRKLIGRAKQALERILEGDGYFENTHY